MGLEISKGLFSPKSPPKLVMAMINISEITLLLSFAASFVRAVGVFLRELDRLLMAVRRSKTVHAVVKMVRSSLLIRHNLLQALRFGIMADIVIVGFMILALSSSFLPRFALLLLIALLLASGSGVSRLGPPTISEIIEESGPTALGAAALMAGLAIKASGGARQLVDAVFSLVTRA
jgi:hypothetical protein